MDWFLMGLNRPTHLRGTAINNSKDNSNFAFLAAGNAIGSVHQHKVETSSRV